MAELEEASFVETVGSIGGVRYPGISLKAAVERARALYEHEQGRAAYVQVVATEYWGFAAKSSGWRQAVAAMKVFGLIVDEGASEARKIRVTEEARRIILDTRPEPQERRALLQRLALLPPIHRELWDTFGPSLPPDASIIHHLTIERRMEPKTARALLAEFKETATFAGLGQGATLGGSADPKPPAAGAENGTAANPPPPTRFRDRAPVAEVPMRELPITLPSLAVATIEVPVPMTVEDFDFFQSTLAALRARLTAVQPPPTASPQGQKEDEC